MTANEFSVTGMTCGHCESAVRTEVGRIAGVERIEVSASNGRLIVTTNEPVAEQAVIDAVAEAGYRAVRA